MRRLASGKPLHRSTGCGTENPTHVHPSTCCCVGCALQLSGIQPDVGSTDNPPPPPSRQMESPGLELQPSQPAPPPQHHRPHPCSMKAVQVAMCLYVRAWSRGGVGRIIMHYSQQKDHSRVTHRSLFGVFDSFVGEKKSFFSCRVV